MLSVHTEGPPPIVVLRPERGRNTFWAVDRLRRSLAFSLVYFIFLAGQYNYMAGKDEKNPGAFKWLIAGMAALFLILGGLALLAGSAFLLLKPSGPAKGGTDDPGTQCGPQEIKSGAACCTDRNRNGVCDIREDGSIPPSTRGSVTAEASSSSPQETHMETTAPAGTMPPTQRSTTTTSSTIMAAVSATVSNVVTTSTVTSGPATTIPPGKHASSCADTYGISSDAILYVYTEKCCGKTVSPLIARAQAAKGYKYEYVVADALNRSSEGLLKCYLPPGYISVPQLICPANGNTRILTSPGTFDQIISFSEGCVAAAYS